MQGGVGRFVCRNYSGTLVPRIARVGFDMIGLCFGVRVRIVGAALARIAWAVQVVAWTTIQCW